VICSWDGAPEQPLTVKLRACVDNANYACTGDGEYLECHEENNRDDYQGDGCAEAPK
jgi:hypothetical protein